MQEGGIHEGKSYGSQEGGDRRKLGGCYYMKGFHLSSIFTPLILGDVAAG